MRRSALLTASAFIGLASIVAAGTTASASARTTLAPKVVGASSFTLNLLLVPITVDVTTDVAGNLTNAAINPLTPFLPSAVQPNRVVFQNAPGTGSVVVRANHGGQSVTARTANLSDLFGAVNGWTGDVFGTGDLSTKVTFIVGARSGPPPVAPDITALTVVTCGADVAMTCVASPTTYGDDEDDNEGTEAMASVKFSLNGQTRTLRIRVGTHTEDAKTEAVVHISLSKIKGALALKDGPGTWTGLLCDGTTSVTFAYNIAGAVVTVTQPIANAEVKTNEHGVEVRFTDGPRVRIGRVGEDDSTTVGLSVKYHCPAGIPNVNGATPDPTIVTQGGQGDHGGHGGGDGGGDDKNKGNG